MAKFTQQQLEEAWEQMQDERRQDANSAHLAAQWIQQQIGFGNAKFSHPYGHSVSGPYQTKFVLLLVYETYGPYVKDYQQVLAKMPWAVLTQGIPGYSASNPFYEATTPYGKYTLTFEYFDNHVGGW